MTSVLRAARSQSSRSVGQATHGLSDRDQRPHPGGGDPEDSRLQASGSSGVRRVPGCERRRSTRSRVSSSSRRSRSRPRIGSVPSDRSGATAVLKNLLEGAATISIRSTRTPGRRSDSAALRIAGVRSRESPTAGERSGRAPEAGPVDGTGDFGLPSPAGYQQVERDRASSLLVHLAEPARPAVAHPCGQRQSHPGHANHDGPRGPLRAERSHPSQGREARG